MSPVRAALTFLASRNSQAVYIPSVAGGESVDTAQGDHKIVQVPVRNGREEKPDASIETEGFQLVKHEAKDVTDFYDNEQVKTKYHPQIKELLLSKIPGATRVEIFDDTRRSASSSKRSDPERKLREPSANVHNDYTPASGIKRLRTFMEDNFPDEPNVEELLQRRWYIVNVWRSMDGPVLNFPMVFCDSQTVNDDDIIPVERRSANRTGEIQMAVYNESQQWYYFPQLQMDEALLIKTFDSATTCKSIHTSFDDTTAAVDAPPLESIESRCFVFC